MVTGNRANRFPVDNREDRSIVDLLKELRDETTELLRKEIALARVEITDQASKAVRNLAYVAVGGLLLYAGLLVLLVAFAGGIYAGLVAAGLSHYIAGWLAPLIVGAIVSGIGYIILQKGISTLSRESYVPKQTIQSAKETKEWVQEKVS
jgi:Putative Actinobacterial Holin-X, holin superfamily III